jgi:Tfp pilus assembly protein PilO
MNRPSLDQFVPLLRRHTFCAVSTGVSLVLVVVIGLLGQWTVHLETEYRERAQTGEAMLSFLVTGPEIRRELAYAREAVRRIEENLVVETNLAENVWYFYKLEEQTKARLSDLRQLSSTPIESKLPYRPIPYRLRLTGTYEQVAGFLGRLETGPRLALISAFSFRRRDTGGPAVVLELEVELLGKR